MGKGFRKVEQLSKKELRELVFALDIDTGKKNLAKMSKEKLLPLVGNVSIMKIKNSLKC